LEENSKVIRKIKINTHILSREREKKDQMNFKKTKKKNEKWLKIPIVDKN
jgi:hypothetical protein